MQQSQQLSKNAIIVGLLLSFALWAFYMQGEAQQREQVTNLRIKSLEQEIEIFKLKMNSREKEIESSEKNNLLRSDQEQAIESLQEAKVKSSNTLERWITNEEILKAGVIDEEDLPLYDWIADISERFSNHGIEILISQGSLLGARRHLGIIPWGDKDIDFMVFSTNTTAIENVLNTFETQKMIWGYNRDGEGPGEYGFGYALNLPYSIRGKEKKFYVDFWLYGPHKTNNKKITCLGIQDGCKRWYLKYSKSVTDLPSYDIEDILPSKRIPFGPYLFPVPNYPDKILTEVFSDTWVLKCGGWQRGNRLCSDFYPDYPFTFEIGDNVVVKKGNETLISLDRNIYYDGMSFSDTLKPDQLPP